MAPGGQIKKSEIIAVSQKGFITILEQSRGYYFKRNGK